MSKSLATRQAISALLDVGKTPTVIAADLGCSRVTVYRVKKLKKLLGGDLGHAFGPRVKTVMTPRLRAMVKRRIRAAPTKPIAAVARESGVSRQLVSKLVKESGWKSLRRTKVPLISAEVMRGVPRGPRASSTP